MANLVLGRGTLYFDQFAAGTENTTGEFLLAQTPGFSLTATSETLDHYDQDQGLRDLDERVLLQLDRTGSFTVEDISPEGIALFIAGSVSTTTQSSTPVVDESITVKQNRYYQLGATAADPSGVRNVTSVSVTGSGGTPTYVLDTDYTLNAATGRIYIIPTGSIADDTEILVDYTPAAETRSRVATADQTVEGTLRFVASNAKGDNRDVIIPKCQLSPSGTWELKGDEWQNLGFDYAILQKTGAVAKLLVDGRAVA